MSHDDQAAFDFTHELAEFYRAGLHDLSPYWSPDDGDGDPLDDPEVRTTVRRYLARHRRWLEHGRAAGLAVVKVSDRDRWWKLEWAAERAVDKGYDLSRFDIEDILTEGNDR